MSDRRRRLPVIAAAALVFVVAACVAGQPTPTYIHVTLPPESTPQVATPSPTDTLTPTDTPTPTNMPTDTPVAATPTAIASPTAPGSPTPTPSPTPTSLAGGCSGLDVNRTWWAAEAKRLTFDVYCGVVPSGWYFQTASDTYNNGGTMIASYKGPSSAIFTIKEGAFCTTSVAACSPHDTSLGSAKFGDLDGSLYTLTGGGYAIYIGAGTAHGYTATGTIMSQATFVNLAKALIQVPKS